MSHYNHRASSIENRESRFCPPTLAHFRHFRHFIRRGGFSSLYFTLAHFSHFRHFIRRGGFSSLYFPLHLSRILYKSTLFMQNKPNFRKSQMNVSIFSQKDYENKSNWTLGENKPNSNPNKPNLRKAKMNVNLTLTKDYRKKNDFLVRINKPNFFKSQK